MTDLDFMKHITAENMLDPDYLKERAKLIHSQRATDFNVGEPKVLALFICLRRRPAMVSFIQSNYAGFGSGVVVPETGIHLQPCRVFVA